LRAAGAETDGSGWTWFAGLVEEAAGTVAVLQPADNHAPAIMAPAIARPSVSLARVDFTMRAL